uniref:Uncharacterized protein n=1 Tax=Panstrongylus lignarius TaxID=156445 RepID=A0A224XPA8_9HEMI
MGNVFRTVYPQQRSKIFKWSEIKKQYELFPLFALVAIDEIYVLFNILWMPLTRDISFEHRKHPHNMRMDLLHPHWLKLYHINDVLLPRPELHEAYEMLREAERKEYEEVLKAIQEKSKNKKPAP